jgi:hypothetical protein
MSHILEVRMKKTAKHNKPLRDRIEETFSNIAFAEAGELYPRKTRIKPIRNDKAKAHVCVNSETPSRPCS